METAPGAPLSHGKCHHSRTQSPRHYMHNYDYWGTAPLPKLKVLYGGGGAGGVARVIFNRDSSYLEESNYKAPHNFKMGGPYTVIINEGVLPQTSGALFLHVSWL